MNNLLSPEEVKSFLEIPDEDLDRLVNQGKLQAYRIGGAYLRFRKEDILTLKHEIHPGKKTALSIPWFVRIWDFWRFNNFYILSLLLIGILFYFVARS